MAVDVREYVTGFVASIIAVVITVNLVPVLMTQMQNVTGIPLLTAGLVGTVVGAGVLLFILKVFL
jgi:uncharacterized membrane protein YeaQ/YmgE (transglycosylase-associated protein family)